MTWWFRGLSGVVTIIVTSVGASRAESTLFMQPGTTLRDVTIPRYTEGLASDGLLRVAMIRVADDGKIQADRLSVELRDNSGGRGWLRAGSALLERGFDGIRTADGTELRMGGIELETCGVSGDLRKLEFVSTGGFQLKCRAGRGSGLLAVSSVRSRPLEWRPGAVDPGQGRGPMAGPRGPEDAFWFDGRLGGRLAFRSDGGGRAAALQDPVTLLSKGPGNFRVREGAYSSSGGVLIGFSLGTIACGDRVEVVWGGPEPVRRRPPSKVLPGDLRRLRAAGGCHLRLTDRKGRLHVVVCEEVRYSGKTGLVSLKGGYPRIDSAEGRLMASSADQYLRINAEGRLILGPGHWLSDHAL